MTTALSAAEVQTGAPKVVQLMRVVANRTPTVQVDGHLSTVFSPPAIDYFPGMLALANVRSRLLPEVNRSHDLGMVATIVGTSLRDAAHSFRRSPDGETGDEHLSGSRFMPGTFPPLQLLPDEFPQRRNSSIPAGADVLLGPSTRNPEVNREACWAYFNLCVNPVLVICQQPSKVADELAQLAAQSGWWSPEQLAATIEVGTSPDEWFRRPILCISPRSIQNRRWLGELMPSAVIVIGYSAWATPARWIWPKLPHNLFLDNRSDDVLRFRTWHDGQQFPPIHSELADLRGIPGLPAKLFTEPIQSTEQFSDTDWDAHGADFE
jgi:hypothetical protein